MTKEIKSLIDNAKTCAVFFHIGPDGDAIGSGLALKEALTQLGKNVTVFSQDEIGKDFEFLKPESIKTEIVSTKFDLGFVLDCSEIKRIGTMEAVLKNCEKVINIDHHLNNENFTKFQIVEPEASSTCELMCYFLKQLGIEFTKQIKIDLYCGLATDTGCFMYNLDKKAYSAAEFLTDGICDEIEKLNYTLFREKTFEELKLTGEAISKLESHLDNKFAITDIMQRDLLKHNVPIECTPNIIFLVSGLKDYDVICVICEEKAGVFRVSFRSNKVDVSELARMFGGGGHKFAAGCKIYGGRNAVKNKILKACKVYFDGRNN